MENIAIWNKIPYNSAVCWKVVFSKKATKQKEKLPEHIQEILAALVIDIEAGGPVRGDWAHYSKLSAPNTHHCHLNKRGRPTFVACWSVKDKTIQIVEVYYVGTREKAPY